MVPPLNGIPHGRHEHSMLNNVNEFIAVERQPSQHKVKFAKPEKSRGPEKTGISVISGISWISEISSTYPGSSLFKRASLILSHLSAIVQY